MHAVEGLLLIVVARGRLHTAVSHGLSGLPRSLHRSLEALQTNHDNT